MKLWNHVEKPIYPQLSTTKIVVHPQLDYRDKLFIFNVLQLLSADSTASTTMTIHVIFPHEKLIVVERKGG